MGWPLPTCSFQGGDAADLGLGNAVYPGVGDDHDGHRDVEADEGGGDGVGAVQADVAAGAGVPPVLGFVPVQLHRDKGDEDGEGPGHGDHSAGQALCHPALVAKGAGDGPVPVQADDAEVEDGGGGAHNVKGHPGVAKAAAKEPEATGYLSDRLPGHHQDGHAEVRDGQRQHKPVGDFSTQVAEAQDGQAHQSVACQRAQHQGAQQAACQCPQCPRAARHARHEGHSAAGGTSPAALRATHRTLPCPVLLSAGGCGAEAPARCLASSRSEAAVEVGWMGPEGCSVLGRAAAGYQQSSSARQSLHSARCVPV